MGNKSVPLSDVCEIVSGSTPKRNVEKYWNGDIHWVTPKDLSKLKTPYISDTPETITKEGYKSCATNLLPPNSVLLSSRAPIGLVAINTIPMCTNQGFKSFIPSSDVDSLYLYYFLRNNTSQLNHLGSGSTFKEISKRVAGKFKIPLPPLEEQKRIASILDKADELRQKRKKTIEKLDELLQSIFLDMFGDPVTNPKGWDEVTFKECLDSIQNGVSPVCEDKPAELEYWGVLKLSAVTGGKYKQEENKKLPDDIKPKKTIEVKNYDLLFSRKNTMELVGSCAYIFKTRAKLLLPDIIFRLNTKNDISKVYIWALFNSKSFKKCISSLASGSAGSMPNISKKRLEKLIVPLPPYKLQQAFENIIYCISSKNVFLHMSLEKTSNLLNSITQKHLKGNYH